MIQIIDYQARWPEEFREVGKRLRKALGRNALAIHHIGSTSVPGLAAKDVIDIQITVADLSASLDQFLVPLGFEVTDIFADHCPPDMNLAAGELQKRYFRVKDRRINLHVRQSGAFNQRYAVLFRDYLKATPSARTAYGEIKKQLAGYFPENADAYYDIKDPVCDLVMAGAYRWADEVGWKQPVSDE